MRQFSKTLPESQFQNVMKYTYRQKHVWTRRSTSSIASAVPRRDAPKTFQDEHEMSSYNFQQVPTPEYEEKFAYTKFKGLETDFPCLTKK